MFYILPCIASACKSKVPAMERFVQKRDQRWKVMDTVGLALDAFLIASACIAVGLALCVYFGLPMGPLNCLSVLTVPYISSIGGAAALLLIADIIRIICKDRKVTYLDSSERLLEERESYELA